MDTLKLTPWTSPGVPTEPVIRSLMQAEGLSPYAWSNAPHDVYAAHSHTYNKVIYCVTGSITFGLPDERRQLTLHPGDRLELPAGLVHDAVVGSDGVLCLEAHR
jgi:quercetin dioxygenase-like cupin family protein